MKRILIILLSYMFLLNAYTQSITFNKSYIPIGNDLSALYNIIATDTNYLCYGVSQYLYPQGLLAFRMDSTGVIHEAKIYGDTNVVNFCEDGESIIRNNYNPYLIALSKDYNYSPYKKNGVYYKFEGIDTISTKIVYSDTMTFATLSNCLLDNYYYSVGTKAYNVNDADHYDAVLLKSDTLGNMVWIKRYGGTSMELGYKIIETYDNNLIMAVDRSGYDSSYPLYKDHQWWILKLDTAGNVIWDENYGHPDLIDGRPVGLIETLDSCYIITGSYCVELSGTSGEILRGRILKIDKMGNIVWDKLYGHKSLETHVGIIKEKSNNSLITYLFNATPGCNFHPIIQELTESGAIKWHRKYYFNNDTNSDNSVFNSFDFTNDGGYIFAGHGIDFDSVPSQRSWVIKTDSLGFDGTYYTGDTTLAITLATDTVCYNDSVLVTFHVTGKSAPYSIELSNGNTKDSIFYSPYYEEYAYDSLYIYPSDSLIYHNITATVTDPWGNNVTENLSVYVDGCWNSSNELSEMQDYFKIYPNPTNKTLIVEYPVNKLWENANIKIYDLTGKFILLVPIDKQSGVKTIDVSAIPDGNYLFTIGDKKSNTYSKQITVLH